MAETKRMITRVTLLMIKMNLSRQKDSRLSKPRKWRDSCKQSKKESTRMIKEKLHLRSKKRKRAVVRIQTIKRVRSASSLVTSCSRKKQRTNWLLLSFVSMPKIWTQSFCNKWLSVILLSLTQCFTNFRIAWSISILSWSPIWRNFKMLV